MNAEKETLVVKLDWSSTGIWSKGKDHYSNASYDWLKLPAGLMARFEYWSWWYNRSAPEQKDSASREPNEKFFEAYGLSIAIDLKRVVGDRFHVEFRGEKIEVPNPKTLHEVYDHLAPDTQPEDDAWMKEFPIPGVSPVNCLAGPRGNPE